MSELIDREALKDAVKRYAGEPIKEKDRKCQAICLDMLGTIDSQPTASPWHSVEEELPKKVGSYITAYCDGFVCENQWHYIGPTAIGWVNDAEAVRYWMPLPEPPKGDA